jgi:DNA gyrase subunit A
VTENGYGKRTEMVEYMRLGEDGARGPQNRGGKGMRNYGINEKTGRVTGICIVDDSDDIMLIETGGVIIRMAASAVNIYKRGTRGVILMRVEDGNRGHRDCACGSGAGGARRRNGTGGGRACADRLRNS